MSHQLAGPGTGRQVGRHRRGAPARPAGRHARPAAADRTRPWLAALAGTLALAAAVLAAVVDDPRLLRVAVLLAILAAVPFGVAMTAGVAADGRRLAGEVAALRAAVDALVRRPEPLQLPPTVLALASSYAAPAAPAPAWDATPRHAVDLGAPAAGAGAPPPGWEAAVRTPADALRLPLVREALRAAAEGAAPAGPAANGSAANGPAANGSAARPADRPPLLLDLVALEDEVQQRRGAKE